MRRHIQSIGVMTVAIALLASAAFPQEQGANFPAPIAPDGLKFPAWLKPGTRLTYYMGSCALNQVHTILVKDPNAPFDPNGDDWRDPKTGQKYNAVELPNVGGSGYMQYNIVGGDEKNLAVDTRKYSMIDVQGNMLASPSGAYVGNVTGLGEYWVHPARLAAAKEERSPTHQIHRMPYKLGDREFKAIAYTSVTGAASFHYVFDTETGILLYYGSCTPIASPGFTPNANGTTSSEAPGGVMIVSIAYREVRDLKLPWVNAPTPPGVAKGQQMAYRGTQSTVIPGAPPIVADVTSTFGFTDVGGNWIASKLASTIDHRGISPNQQSTTDRCLGPGAATPMWVDPKVLRGLEPNKVIDEDKLARTRVTYAGVQGNNGVVVEQSQVESLSAYYDLNTGWLAAISHVQSMGPSQVQTQLQYVGAK